MSHRSKSVSPGRGGRYDTVAVRIARPEDEAAIWRVAALDSKDLPAGPTLVAEADGEVIAALEIQSGVVAADPFRWTADVVSLMKLRAAQLDERTTLAITSGGGQAVQPLRTQLT